MRKHAGESLPRLYLLLGHQSVDVLPKVVQRLLQRPFAIEQAFYGEMERKLVVSDRFAHQSGTEPQLVLMVEEEERQSHRGGNDREHCNAYHLPNFL